MPLVSTVSKSPMITHSQIEEVTEDTKEDEESEKEKKKKKLAEEDAAEKA